MFGNAGVRGGEEGRSTRAAHEAAASGGASVAGRRRCDRLARLGGFRARRRRRAVHRGRALRPADRSSGGSRPRPGRWRSPVRIVACVRILTGRRSGDDAPRLLGIVAFPALGSARRPPAAARGRGSRPVEPGSGRPGPRRIRPRDGAALVPGSRAARRPAGLRYRRALPRRAAALRGRRGRRGGSRRPRAGRRPARPGCRQPAAGRRPPAPERRGDHDAGLGMRRGGDRLASRSP